MRDEDEVSYPNVVMATKKKTVKEEIVIERKQVDLTFAPLTEEEKL